MNEEQIELSSLIDAKGVAKWLGEFQKVLDAKTAARVIQIDRRLSLVHQLQFTEKIPLIH